MPIKPQNRPQSVTKLSDGSLKVQLPDRDFTIAPEDEELQAFVIYTMLNSDCH